MFPICRSFLTTLWTKSFPRGAPPEQGVSPDTYFLIGYLPLRNARTLLKLNCSNTGLLASCTRMGGTIGENVILYCSMDLPKLTRSKLGRITALIPRLRGNMQTNTALFDTKSDAGRSEGKQSIHTQICGMREALRGIYPLQEWFEGSQRQVYT